MPFGTQNSESAKLFGFRRQFDIGTTTGHVGGNRHGTTLTGLSHDFTLTGMLFGVQHIVRNFSSFQHAAKRFRYVNAGSTDEHRLTGFMVLPDFVDSRVIFFPLGPENQILFVITDNRAIGRNYGYIQLINFVELTLFRGSCTGHAGKLVIHPEVVLQGDSGIGLSGSLYLHVLFGFNGLVQSVRIATSGQNTARMLIHDLDFAVLHNVLLLSFKEGIGFQELVYGMDTVAPLGKQPVQFVEFLLPFLFHLLLYFSDFLLLVFIAELVVFLNLFDLLIRELIDLLFDFRSFRAKIGNDKEIRIFILTGDKLPSFLGHLYRLLLHVDSIIQILINDRHVFGIVGKVDFLRILHQPLICGFLHQLAELAVFREAPLGPVQGKPGFIHFALFNKTLRIIYQRSNQALLSLYKRLHPGFHLLIFLLGIRLGYRTGNNERCSRFINQNGVNLINNGKMMVPLYQLFLLDNHIVPEVVKAEFVIGTVSDVGPVCFASGFGVGIVPVDAVYREAMEVKDWFVPLSIPLGQVGIYGYNMNTASGQCIKVGRENGSERFTFTRFHLGNGSIMHGNGSNQLHVIRHHVPLNFCPCHFPFFTDKTAAGLFENRIGFRKNFVEGVFKGIKPLVFQFCKLIRKLPPFFKRNGFVTGIHLFLYLFNFTADICVALFDEGFERFCFFFQIIF